MRRYALPLVSVLFFASCNSFISGTPFTIDAIYQAPLSKLQVTVNGHGRVPSGHDIADTYTGTVLIEPLASHGQKVELVFADESYVTYAISSDSPVNAKWGFRNDTISLKSILEQSGYTQLNVEEITEIVQVISGAFLGPKAVTFDGQSEYLKVIDVKVNRRKPDIE